MLLLLTLACGGPAASPAPGDPPADSGAVDCDASLTWETAAAPLLLSSCAPCHAAGRVGEERYGAPEGVDLDTPEGAIAHGERLLARLEQGDMPPATTVPAWQVERVAAWLACGGPGAATAWPAGARIEGYGLAESRTAQVAADPDEPRLLELRVSVESEEGPWLIERWWVEGQDLSLAARERYDADGSLLAAATWDPPIQLVHSGGAAGVTDTQRTHEDATGLASWPERWIAEAPAEDIADPLLAGEEGTVQVVASSDGGATLGLVLSWTGGLLQRWYEEPGAVPGEELASFAQVPADRGPDPPEGGLYDGQLWFERVYTWEAP